MINSFKSIELGIEIYEHTFTLCMTSSYFTSFGWKWLVSFAQQSKLIPSIAFNEQSRQIYWGSLFCVPTPWSFVYHSIALCSAYVICKYDIFQTHQISIVQGLNLHLQIAHQFNGGILNLWVFLHLLDDARNLIDWEWWIFGENLWT